METLRKQLSKKQKPVVSFPYIFDLSKQAHITQVSKLLKTKIENVVDDYEEQVKELFAINNPTKVYAPDFATKFSQHFTALKKKAPLYLQGRWIYYPWLASLVHVLTDLDFQRVRTARNRNLISPEEQKKFYNAVVGIGGLSVGNSVALAIVLQGGARTIRLADFDRLALSNLNRIRSGVQSLGLKKVELTARQIYELNPYAKVEIFSEGLTPKNIDRFFKGPAKLDVVIDELDNLAVKYLIRQKARQFGVPVLMGADNGDNAVIDVERYDQNKKTEFFHGRVGKTTYNELTKLDKFGIGRTITRHIGPENVTEKMQNSLLEMGKTIVSWPQLGGAALLNGSAIAYALRKVVTGQPIENNRKIISLDEKLDPTYNSLSAIKKRAKSAQRFKKIMKLA